MKYDHVLFDADETLFSFDIIRGLKTVFARYEIDFTQAHFVEYQTLNKQLWLEYQSNLISAEHLQITRFQHWSRKLAIPAKRLNEEFLDAMASICQPLPGAINLLHSLKPRAKLGIITNGFERMQHSRISRHGLDGMFDWLVVSELVGKPKPFVDIFDHTFSLMGHPSKERVLMVGDTISSDILGGHNAGIDTCWLQHKGVVNTTDVKPTHTISHLDELHNIIGL